MKIISFRFARFVPEKAKPMDSLVAAGEKHVSYVNGTGFVEPFGKSENTTEPLGKRHRVLFHGFDYIALSDNFHIGHALMLPYAEAVARENVGPERVNELRLAILNKAKSIRQPIRFIVDPSKHVPPGEEPELGSDAFYKLRLTDIKLHKLKLSGSEAAEPNVDSRVSALGEALKQRIFKKDPLSDLQTTSIGKPIRIGQHLLVPEIATILTIPREYRNSPETATKFCKDLIKDFSDPGDVTVRHELDRPSNTYREHLDQIHKNVEKRAESVTDDEEQKTKILGEANPRLRKLESFQDSQFGWKDRYYEPSLVGIGHVAWTTLPPEKWQRELNEQKRAAYEAAKAEALENAEPASPSSSIADFDNDESMTSSAALTRIPSIGSMLEHSRTLSSPGSSPVLTRYPSPFGSGSASSSLKRNDSSSRLIKPKSSMAQGGTDQYVSVTPKKLSRNNTLENLEGSMLEPVAEEHM